MSALLFNLAIDCVMCRSTEVQKRGIQWTLFSTLEDLNSAADISLQSHTHCYMQEKTSILSTYARQVRLNINLTKTEVMTLNTSSLQKTKIDGVDLPMTQQFKWIALLDVMAEQAQISNAS